MAALGMHSGTGSHYIAAEFIMSSCTFSCIAPVKLRSQSVIRFGFSDLQQTPDATLRIHFLAGAVDDGRMALWGLDEIGVSTRRNIIPCKMRASTRIGRITRSAEPYLLGGGS
jgi:hypothetical protein